MVYRGAEEAGGLRRRGGRREPAMLKNFRFHLFKRCERDRDKRVLLYLRDFLNVIVEMCLLLVCFVVAYGLVLYLVKAMWYLYLDTFIGRSYAQIFPHNAAGISEILEDNPFKIAVRFAASAFVFSLAVGAVSRFSTALRFFYDPYGELMHFTCWGTPVAVALTFINKSYFAIYSWGCSFFFTVVPAFFLFRKCFEYCQRLLPEMDDLKFILRYFKKGKDALPAS